METKNRAGFKEVQHTADWALQVWAPDLAGLFVQAALGMQKLMGVQLSDGLRGWRRIDHEAEDHESLIINFLNDILFWIETDQLGSDRFDLLIEGKHLHGFAETAPVESISKEIKAVTFHLLRIDRNDDLFQTTIVFDV